MDLWRPLAAQGSDLLLMGACTVNYILCPPPPAQWRRFKLGSVNLYQFAITKTHEL